MSIVKFVLALATISVVSAFAPVTQQQGTSSLNVASGGDSLNGWVPDESKFAFGLPGSLNPAPEFDPFGYAVNADVSTMKTYREAEITHGRVAMLAFVGFLVTEAPFEFHPLFNIGDRDIGPAIRHLDEVRAAAPFFFEILAVTIGAAELKRALTGWVAPNDVDQSALRDNYYPGDVGFDPLGLKPDGAEDFAIMATKELQHGRLAMLATAGLVAQELVDGKEILVHAGVAPDNFDPLSLPIQF